MKDKQLSIMWAWLSGFDFMGSICGTLTGNWGMIISFGICSILTMGLAILTEK